MDKLRALYESYIENGVLSSQTTFEQFSSANSTVQDDLYRQGVDKKIVSPSTDINIFKSAWGAEPIKKKVDTVLPSEDGLSVLPKKDEVSFYEVNKDMPVITQEILNRATLDMPRDGAARRLKEIEDERKERLEVSKMTEALVVEEKKKQLELDKEFERQNLGLRNKKEFTDTLNSVITSNLVAKTEEEAIKELRNNFSQYGIAFEESGFGDNIIARTLDGKKSIEISFDNWTDGGNVEASNKLKDFVSQNSFEVERSKNEDFLNKAIKAKNLRSVAMQNPDGSESTVKFTSFEQDGKFKVIPTLFPKDPNNYTTDRNTWSKLPLNEAIKVAEERGEVFEFETEKEADDFSRGAWKDLNPVDIEADKFYKERGLDYISNKKIYDEYIKVRDMVSFLELYKNDRKITDEDAGIYKKFIINGRMRSDIDEKIEEFKKQEDELRSQVFDDTFLSEGKIQKTREEFDEYLEKRQNQKSIEAAKINSKAKSQAIAAETESINNFGLPLKDLEKYTPKNKEEELKKNTIISLYEGAKITQSYAAKKYEDAKTYFDAKTNKQIKGEYEDNWSSYTNEVSNAYKNGVAAEQILAFGLGIKDVDSSTDKIEAAKIIVENLTNQNPNTSRVMSRWQQASGFSESIDVLADNPFELMLTMASTSMSQILPYGSKIVPATTASGAGTGAVTGLLGGPFAEVTVPAGAIAGGTYGFRTGMAATMLAMEYTNSVLDVMREKGYDVNNPDEVVRGFEDETVWEEGTELGLKRGIPIAVIDYLSAGLAGKVFKPTSAIASKGTRIALQTTERAVFDPLAEAAGELTAQAVSGQEIDWKEISAEAIGGLGNNSSNMAINTFRTIKNNTDINIANNLADVNFLGTESASDSRISTWANNMQKLGKIDADLNQRIQENIGLRREAREVLSVGVEKSSVNPNVLARTMELMSAKEQLSSTTNRREIYSDKIKAINKELSTIAETKKLLPESESIDLNLTIGSSKKGVGQYMINGVRYTKEQFLEKTKNMSARRILRSALGVKNDEETGNQLDGIIKEKLESQLTAEELLLLQNTEENAIQEQITAEVPVQSETGISETLEEKISESESKIATEQATQEKIKELESELEAIDDDNNPRIAEIDSEISELEGGLAQPQTIINEEGVSSKTQEPVITPDESIEVTETKKEGTVEEVKPKSVPGFNEGVTQVQDTAKEYKEFVNKKLKEEGKRPQTDRSNLPVPKLFTRVSKMISDAYDSIKNEPSKAEVKLAYDALVKETAEQYNFIKQKGLKIIRHEGKGEPYANSKEMLADLRDNNTLKFLPNEVAFGQGPVDATDNIGLQPSGLKLDDGYELTNSEVFRVVHDYFGHGILGNQFGAIGEENATLQHIDLYSDEAAPAVIFQTRGQNSWVNFSGANKEANDLRKKARELRKEGKVEEANKLIEEADKLFKFAEPKINIFPTKLNFKRYETARRINEQEELDKRPNKRANVLSKLLEKYSKRSSGARGVNKRDIRGTKRLRGNDVKVVAEYTLDKTIDSGIKKAFPLFKGVQKIYEITDGATYREMMIESLKDNKFAASVTVHSAEDFNGMRMFVTEDGSTGITITKEGFLGGAFSDPTSNKPNNLAQLMIIGIKEGATTAEAFDTVLPDYYANFGFKAVSRTAFNDEFKPMIENGNAVKDWDYNTYKKFNNGKPDVVFFIYDGGSRDNIEDRLGLFDLYKSYEKANTESFDENGYEQAEEVMKQQAVKRLEFELGSDQTLSEQDLPGFDRMMGEVEGIIEKSKKRRVKQSKIADNVMNYAMGSKAYENATDVQREALVRDVRKRFGLKEKKAPSVNRILGKIKDVKKVTMTEKTALKNRIKDLARGARDAVKAQKIISKELTKEIKTLASSGKITSKQAANILRAFSNVNVFSDKSVGRFTTYMTKVFENAEYASNLSQAKKDRSSIKKLSKNKDKNANLRVLAAQFIKIDPALVEDINAYNDMASKIKEAIKGSSIRGQKVNFAQTVNIEGATDYINNEIELQEEKIRNERIAEIQELMGVDASDFSAEQMLALLKPEAKTTKYNEGIVRATVKRAFDIYSAMIKKTLSTGKNVFTDEDVSYDSTQKDIIKRFMAMDTNNMNIKESVEAVDALANFIENSSTAKMESVIRKYTGKQKAAEIKKEGIFAIPLTKLFSKSFGRFLGEQTTTLNILFEKMFVGFNRSGKVMDAMGLTDLVNGKSKAQRQSNTIINEYVSDFFNKKANNQAFNTLYNNVERGMTSFIMRNIIGTETEMNNEFNRRKNLIKESIEVLSNGNKEERAKSLVYQEVYDNILEGSKNIDEVQSKVDNVNLEAVDFWIKQWDSKFQQLSDTALNIYNKVLNKDLNYTPDRFTRISYDGGSVDLANNDSAFISNTNGRLYKKETGVLMEATRPSELPKNNDSNEAESYIDLSFDKNNSNSMYDALVDIETAAPIRQVEAFMNTADFRRIFGVDADLIKGTKGSIGRVQQYIQNIRNKNPYSNDEFAKSMRVLNKIATLGVGQALAGPTQPLKQVIPVIMNTLVNTKGNIDVTAMSNPEFMKWLNGIGYAISNRGVESQADIESINKMINQAAETKGAKAVALLEKANKKYLDLFLVKPDVWVAVSSWKSYYEQSLKKQGIDPKSVDYASHEINSEAANYAQKMVDRQQNISDTDMSGTLFSNRNPFAQTMVKIFMPFASFRMNQSSRLGADLRTLQNWNVSSKEDKQIASRSLAGYAVEMATFRTLSVGISIGLASLASSLMGKSDDEEEKEKRRNNLIKGAATSTVTDIISPIPVFDRLIQNKASDILEGIQNGFDIPEEERVSLYNAKKQNFVDGLGTFGITAKRSDELWQLLSMSVTGEYEDGFGKTKTISEEDKEALGKIFPVILTSNLTGFASPEITSVGRNAVRIAKKKGPTYEQLEAKNKKVEIIEDMISKARNTKQREAAQKLLDKLKSPDYFKFEEKELKDMKLELLVDERKGVTYKNVTELKRYNKRLWEKNFGPKSQWAKLTKADSEAKKMMNKELQKEKDKSFNYKKSSKKNKDGSSKRKYSYKKKKN